MQEEQRGTEEATGMSATRRRKEDCSCEERHNGETKEAERRREKVRQERESSEHEKERTL